MIDCAISKNAELVIVSRDGDYGSTYGSKSYINDDLRQEFSNRVSQKRELLLYTKVSDALKHFNVTVTQAQVEAEAELAEQVALSEKLLAELIHVPLPANDTGATAEDQIFFGEQA